MIQPNSNKTVFKQYHGDKRVECDFLNCAAGEGVLHRGVCTLGGDFSNRNCPNKKTKGEFKKWLKKEMQSEKKAEPSQSIKADRISNRKIYK